MLRVACCVLCGPELLSCLGTKNVACFAGIRKDSTQILILILKRSNTSIKRRLINEEDLLMLRCCMQDQ